MFKLKINKNESNDEKVIHTLPEMPFVVKWDTGNIYLVSKSDEKEDYVVLTHLENGVSYDRSIEYFLDNINKNHCQLLKSEINIL